MKVSGVIPFSYLSLFLGMLIISGPNINVIGQGPYSLILDQNSVTLDQDEGANIVATFLLDSSAVDNAQFEIRDSTGEIFFDIAESQISLGGGQYGITLNENQTRTITPGSYSLEFVGIDGENEFGVNFGLDVVSIDLVEPILTILQPNFDGNFNLTVFKLILEVEDNVGWHDLEISVGDLTVLYLKNTGIVSNSSSRLYNQTHLHLEEWISLIDITGASNSLFSIMARDIGLNEVLFELLLEGDYTKPEIKFNSHTNNERIFSRVINLQWAVADVSEIKSQILTLNGIIFQPGGRALTSSERSFEFNLPIKEDEAQFLTFSLTVTDIFENREVKSVEIVVLKVTSFSPESLVTIESVGSIGLLKLSKLTSSS